MYRLSRIVACKVLEPLLGSFRRIFPGCGNLLRELRVAEVLPGVDSPAPDLVCIGGAASPGLGKAARQGNEGIPLRILPVHYRVSKGACRSCLIDNLVNLGAD